MRLAVLPLPIGRHASRGPILTAVKRYRLLLFMGVLALLFATAGEAAACGTHGTQAGNELNDWLFGDTDGDGFFEAYIGIEDLFVPPTVTTVCICGIGLGTTQNPLAPNVQVTAARIAIANVVTREIEDLGAFSFSPNANTTEGLTNGSGPGGPPDTNPLVEGATWFGFAGTVEPFELPMLGPNEIFALGFDLRLRAAELPLVTEVQFAAGEGDESGNPLFFGEHPPGYFTANDPVAVLPEPGAAQRLAAILGAIFVLLQAQKNGGLRRGASASTSAKAPRDREWISARSGGLDVEH